MSKTILITGGAGYIGSACVKYLIKAGNQVVVFDDFSTGQADKVDKRAQIIEGDVTNRGEVLSACRRQAFDAVIHSAAKKAVGESEVNPDLYFRTNVVGSFNVLSAMADCQIPHLIFSSTAAVYEPSRDGRPIFEDGPLRPVNVYGRTKLIVEEMIKDYARLGQISRYQIFRYFNVAGDVGLNYQEKNAQNVFPLLARSATWGEKFSVYGTDYETKDGTGVRDYIHLSDLALAHQLALDSELSGVYNLGTGQGYSVQELIDAFSQEAGQTLKVAHSPRRAGDPAVLTANAELAKKQLGWEPKQSLAEMVKSTMTTYSKETNLTN